MLKIGIILTLNYIIMTTQDYIKQTQDFTNCEDFRLTQREWADFESGTRATRVKCYNDNGKLISIDYVIKGIFKHDDAVFDLQQVSCGYITDTVNVKRI